MRHHRLNREQVRANKLAKKARQQATSETRAINNALTHLLVMELAKVMKWETS
jgi:hypothetical protein